MLPVKDKIVSEHRDILFDDHKRNVGQSEWVNLFVRCAQGSTGSVTEGGKEEGERERERAIHIVSWKCPAHTPHTSSLFWW